MVTTKYHSRISDVSNYSSINFIFISGLQTEIFYTVYCWIVHLSFLTSHNLLFFSLCKKPNIFCFSDVFLVKLSKFRSLKLNISRTAWPTLMILVSFFRMLNGFSDEINLFWRCSSPLRDVHISFGLIFNWKFLSM